MFNVPSLSCPEGGLGTAFCKCLCRRRFDTVSGRDGIGRAVVEKCWEKIYAHRIVFTNSLFVVLLDVFRCVWNVCCCMGVVDGLAVEFRFVGVAQDF